jgi:hypothetical protein
MSRHSTFPLTGSVKMVLRVFRFLLFMPIVLSKYVSTVNDNAKFFSLQRRHLIGDPDVIDKGIIPEIIKSAANQLFRRAR